MYHMTHELYFKSCKATRYQNLNYFSLKISATITDLKIYHLRSYSNIRTNLARFDADDTW